MAEEEKIIPPQPVPAQRPGSRMLDLSNVPLEDIINPGTLNAYETPRDKGPMPELDSVREELYSLSQTYRSQNNSFTPQQSEDWDVGLAKMGDINLLHLAPQKSATEGMKMEMEELKQIYHESVKKKDWKQALTAADDIKMLYEDMGRADPEEPFTKLQKELETLNSNISSGKLQPEQATALKDKMRGTIALMRAIQRKLDK